MGSCSSVVASNDPEAITFFTFLSPKKRGRHMFQGEIILKPVARLQK
jgi:hypothetical protein